MTLNDNDRATRGISSTVPDAHGQAALLLIESLIHGLCEKSALSVGEAVEIVERAVDVQFDQAEIADDADAWRSHTLLLSIAESLKIDADDVYTSPRLVE